MSEAITLVASVRKDIGKGASRRLRHAEKVPAVIYGGDEAPVSIVMEARVVKRALEEEAFYSQIISLDVDSKKHEVILKDLQRHPAKGNAMHLDFLRIDATSEITTNIPLHFINEEACIGVKAGGKLSHNVTEIEVRCLPAALPEFIEVDVETLELGNTIHLSDLTTPKDVQFTQLTHGDSHNLAVVSVNAPKLAAEPEETTDAPEAAEDKEDDKEA